MARSAGIGSRLRKAREAIDMTQQTAAERLGIAQGTLSIYESGRNGTPAEVPNSIVASAFRLYQLPDEDALVWFGVRGRNAARRKRRDAESNSRGRNGDED